MLRVNSLLCVEGKSAMAGFSQLFFVAVLALIMSSCNSDDDGAEERSFNRTEMLTWYADELIVPSFESSKNAAVALEEATNSFTATPNENTLLAVQEQWKQAYASFQNISAYNFGPGSSPSGSLLENLGTFPVDTTLLLNYINQGDFSLNNFDRDTRGYLGVEYLIFEKGGNKQLVLHRFADENFKEYLSAIVGRILEVTQSASDEWSSYRTDFISNNGTDPGSSVSLMYNEFIKAYEAHKNFKVALPAGKRAGQTNPQPSMVECYYSGMSADFQQQFFEAFTNMYSGTNANGENGIGWDDYLATVPNGDDLVSTTQSQFTQVENTFELLPNQRFSETVAQQPPSLDNYYTELSKLTRYVKSDMSSSLGIAITYDSGDGD